MENNTQNDRRARMLDKVRKLMAMGRDARGNETETETAMRQANKLMAEFGIEEAEVDMQALDADAMVFGETACGQDGRAPVDGKVYRSLASYAGVVSVGVARFCDAIVTRKRTEHGELLVFRGAKEDVLFARWLFGVLIDSIHIAQKASGWTARGDASGFRNAAAGTLQKRLRDLAAERKAMYEQAKRESGSRALMVVDRKALEVATRFGAQKTKRSGGYSSGSGAGQAGAAAGQRINIPAGRPIGGTTRAAIR